jgi:alpha-methylacyl-CoA racemase
MRGRDQEALAMGPLAGIKAIEFAGVGPGPFCGMLLSDMGADVIRIDRADAVGTAAGEMARRDLLNRGRRSIAVDLKQPAAVELVLKLIDSADALFEGFRPGVMERLGLGPDVCHARNSRLVYGRMTGWGQEGPYASAAGHDLNYIALAGALEPIGERGGPPIPPLNLVADFGGGGMLLAFGVMCGIVDALRSGQGQVVDSAMVDGVALLTTCIHMLKATDRWHGPRGANLLDGGAHFYHVYQCADDRYITVAAGEPQFYAQLLDVLELDPDDFPQSDESRWEEMTDAMAKLFRERTRQEWDDLLGGGDTCFAPVLSPWEAHEHPHNAHRKTFVTVDGIVQPAPAPRFSRATVGVQGPPPTPGQHSDSILAELGYSSAAVQDLRATGAVA